MLVLAQKAHEHLLERLVEEEHNMVALGSARSPRTPTNLIEKGPDSRSLEELEVVESSSRLNFDQLCVVNPDRPWLSDCVWSYLSRKYIQDIIGRFSATSEVFPLNLSRIRLGRPISKIGLGQQPVKTGLDWFGLQQHVQRGSQIGLGRFSTCFAQFLYILIQN
jgi:hypothetical protein